MLPRRTMDHLIVNYLSGGDEVGAVVFWWTAGAYVCSRLRILILLYLIDSNTIGMMRTNSLLILLTRTTPRTCVTAPQCYQLATKITPRRSTHSLSGGNSSRISLWLMAKQLVFQGSSEGILHLLRYLL